MSDLTKNAATRLTHANLRTDANLTIDFKNGVAYQTDTSERIPYDEEYYGKVSKKTNKNTINDFRRKLVDMYVGKQGVLDFGCGDCSFIKARENTWGFDINDMSRAEAESLDKYHHVPTDGYEKFSGVTFWDSLEHLRDPARMLAYLNKQTIFISIPISPNLLTIKQWKHYRPNEHYSYFTNNGFIEWMAKQGWECIDQCDDETKAGREDILTYVMRRKHEHS